VPEADIRPYCVPRHKAPPIRITATLADGQKITRQLEKMPGFASELMTRADVERKFRSNVGQALVKGPDEWDFAFVVVVGRNRPSELIAEHPYGIANVRFGSFADMCSAKSDVRYVPIADTHDEFSSQRDTAYVFLKGWTFFDRRIPTFEIRQRRPLR
jgi:hypothetical protein